MKQIDETAERLGVAMLRARKIYHLSREEVARILHVTPAELAEYEHGVSLMPVDMLAYVFLMGYKMMRVRILEHRYREHRRQFRKLKQTINDIP